MYFNLVLRSLEQGHLVRFVVRDIMLVVPDLLVALLRFLLGDLVLRQPPTINRKMLFYARQRWRMMLDGHDGNVQVHFAVGLAAFFGQYCGLLDGRLFR